MIIRNKNPENRDDLIREIQDGLKKLHKQQQGE